MRKLTGVILRGLVSREAMGIRNLKVTSYEPHFHKILGQLEVDYGNEAFSICLVSRLLQPNLILAETLFWPSLRDFWPILKDFCFTALSACFLSFSGRYLIMC